MSKTNEKSNQTSRINLALAVLATLSLTSAAQATVVYTCRIISVANQEVPTSSFFSTNINVQADDCSPLNAIHTGKNFFEFPGGARAVLDQALATGIKVAVGTEQEVAYGGDAIELNGQALSALDPMEQKTFYVYTTDAKQASTARNLLDHHKVAKDFYTFSKRGKTVRTFDRELILKVGEVVFELNDRGPSIVYGAITKPSAGLRAQFAKSVRGQKSLALDFSTSQQIREFLQIGRNETFTIKSPEDTDGGQRGRPRKVMTLKTVGGIMTISMAE